MSSCGSATWNLFPLSPKKIHHNILVIQTQFFPIQIMLDLLHYVITEISHGRSAKVVNIKRISDE